MVSKARKKFFSKFYDQYVEKIYRFIFLKINSPEVSQDLTAETFTRFWKQLESATEIENPRAFVYSVARHLVIDHYRKGKFETFKIESVQIQDQSLGLEQKEILSSDIKDLKAGLRNLSEDYQDAIIWYYLDGFTVFQIAEMMDKTENATRVTIHRALNALRAQMEGKNV